MANLNRGRSQAFHARRRSGTSLFTKRFWPDKSWEFAMAARRAYWKGYLKLSLVTCPVALYPASSQAEKTHFHQINRKTGNRLRQQMVDERTGKVVDKNDKGRGYELTKGKYVEIEPEEL